MNGSNYDVTKRTKAVQKRGRAFRLTKMNVRDDVRRLLRHCDDLCTREFTSLWHYSFPINIYRGNDVAIYAVEAQRTTI